MIVKAIGGLSDLTRQAGYVDYSQQARRRSSGPSFCLARDVKIEKLGTLTNSVKLGSFVDDKPSESTVVSFTTPNLDKFDSGWRRQ